MLLEPQQTGLKWLKVLKVSQRNWPVNRSVNLKFLNSDRSVRQNPGARAAPGRSVVSVVCVTGGSWSALALYHCVIVCGAPESGLASWFGRMRQGDGPKHPCPVGSMSCAVNGVTGRPVWNVCIPDTSQPPKTCPTNPDSCLRNGRFHTKLAVKICLRSAAEGP